MLVLHIGLPKTATTFLQHWILKPAFGRCFVHRKRGARARRTCYYLKEVARGEEPILSSNYEKLRSSLATYVDGVTEDCSVVVSDENISGRAIQFWQGRGPGPAQLAERLTELRQYIKDFFPTLRVVIGIRRQDQWLASRYAESSTVFNHFGQSDFDRRISDISELESFAPPFDWLDYCKAHTCFSQALGAENVLLLSMERLREEPEAALQELGDFIREPNLVGIYKELITNRQSVIRNKLSEGNDTWKLRRDGSLLRLTSEVQRAILARLADSNRALNQLVPLHFS